MNTGSARFRGLTAFEMECLHAGEEFFVIAEAR